MDAHRIESTANFRILRSVTSGNSMIGAKDGVIGVITNVPGAILAEIIRGSDWHLG